MIYLTTNTDFLPGAFTKRARLFLFVVESGPCLIHNYCQVHRPTEPLHQKHHNRNQKQCSHNSKAKVLAATAATSAVGAPRPAVTWLLTESSFSSSGDLKQSSSINSIRCRAVAHENPPRRIINIYFFSYKIHIKLCLHVLFKDKGSRWSVILGKEFHQNYKILLFF